MHVEPGHRSVEQIPRLPFYAITVLYLVLPALLLLAGSPVIGAIYHREINLDYLLIGAIGVFLPRFQLFVLLLAEFIADCICQICIIYQVAPSQLLRLIHFVPFVPVGRLAGGAAVLLFGIAVCGVLSLLRPRKQEKFWAAGTMMALTIGFLGADFASGQNFFWHNDVKAVPRMERTPLASLGLREAAYRAMVRQSSQQEDGPIRSASINVAALLRRHSLTPEKVNVVLVLVESWGAMNDAQAARGLTDAYDDLLIKNSYVVERGKVPFHGATISGEARELCQSGMGLGLIRISEGRAANCLPQLMQQQGYRTVAIHGFAGGMFLRNEWYPKIGFDESWFLADLEKAGLPRCDGAFPGTCDSSIAQLIGQRLLAAPAGQPQFIYWVTLNSHIPVPLRTDVADDRSCPNRPQFSASKALCSWYRLVRAVHKGVADDLIELQDRPTVFLVVGDHAPPFGDPKLRREFSATEVPYILFVPSSLEQDREPTTKRILRGEALLARSSSLHSRLDAGGQAIP